MRILKSLVPFALMSVVGLGGCVVHGHARTTTYAEADLVYAEPGIYVVAHTARPTFYTGGYYYLYDNGYWLRSSYRTGGWVRTRSVPHSVYRIRNPRVYADTHVRARRSAPRRQPAVRDHRDNRRYDRDDRRDHRNDRRDRRDYRR